jgi:transcriptional regulator with XRE-family HTH domain
MNADVSQLGPRALLTERRKAFTKPPSETARFLKFLRQRIDPEARHLGVCARLPHRLGKRVTQQEIAEAIGVSREWYTVLETAPTARTSPALLKRLADALMVTPKERARLFELAVPEFGRVQLRDDTIAALDAFSHVRSLSKRLWTATSVEDVLSSASEQIVGWFDGCVLVRTTRRREAGLWEAQGVAEKHDRSSASAIIRELEAEVLTTSQEIDALHLYPQLANVGDTGTPELHPLPVRREVLKAFARRRIAGFTFIKGRVRARSGLVAGFCVVHELGHSYSGSDRAVLGAFAQLASLALS